MRCATALSTLNESTAAITDVVERVKLGLEGARGDLAIGFCSPHHASALRVLADRTLTEGIAKRFLGCTAESVVGEDREIENGPALVLWAIELADVDLTPIRLTGSGADGLERLKHAPVDNSCVLMTGDPFTFAADSFLNELNQHAPGLRVIGGMASGGRQAGRNRIVLDGAEHRDGAAAIVLTGPLRIRSIVSQGCRPIGKTFLITRCEENVIRELGRRPALEVLQELFDELDSDDQDRARRGLHIGRVINEYQESFQRGDFLIRNVLGADDAGGIAISDSLRVGQTVQFHVRDAETADEDLRGMLAPRGRSKPRGRIAGGILFTCNGRGSRLFDEPDHDISVMREILGEIPIAGFFAMGEIGPVGGKNFLHGFTASAALFEEPAESSTNRPNA